MRVLDVIQVHLEASGGEGWWEEDSCLSLGPKPGGTSAGSRKTIMTPRRRRRERRRGQDGATTATTADTAAFHGTDVKSTFREKYWEMVLL